MLDLVIRGGTVVTSGGAADADVGVEGERVVQLGGDMRAAREIDARGLLVMPGGVDMHTHLTVPREPGESGPVWVDDFRSGSEAALAGGITTVGNMTFPKRGESFLGALQRDDEVASSLSLVDYVLHPVLADPSEAELAAIAKLPQLGRRSLKIFMVGDDFDRRSVEYATAVRMAGEQRILTLMHCEDNGVIGMCVHDLMGAGLGATRYWARSRPDYSESVAVERAIGIARAARAPVYVVHLSSRAALEACRRARSDGVDVYVETRPLYLHKSEEALEGPDGAKFIGAPPLRSTDDAAAMWEGVRDGAVDTLASDHAPWLLRDKLDPTLDVGNARQGVPDLETLMPMLFSEGVRTGRLSLERFVELVSTQPARLFGLYPRKGTIAVGADADIVVWDPEAVRTVDGAAMYSRSDYSPYDGTVVTGWPQVVISRGEIVAEGGQVLGRPGRGRLLAQHWPGRWPGDGPSFR